MRSSIIYHLPLELMPIHDLEIPPAEERGGWTERHTENTDTNKAAYRLNLHLLFLH